MTQDTKAKDQIDVNTLITSLRDDESLRSQFKENPRQFLIQHKIAVHPECEVIVVEPTNQQAWLVIQEIPASQKKDPLDECIRRALDDPAFFDELKEHPHRVMQEFGVAIPDDIEITVVRNSKLKQYVVLEPLGRVDEEISDDVLDAVSGGGKGWHMFMHVTGHLTGTVGNFFASGVHGDAAGLNEVLGGVERGTGDALNEMHHGWGHGAETDAESNYAHAHHQLADAMHNDATMVKDAKAFARDAREHPLAFAEAIGAQVIMLGLVAITGGGAAPLETGLDAAGDAGLDAGAGAGLDGAGETGVDGAGETGAEGGESSAEHAFDGRLTTESGLLNDTEAGESWASYTLNTIFSGSRWVGWKSVQLTSMVSKLTLFGEASGVSLSDIFAPAKPPALNLTGDGRAETATQSAASSIEHSLATHTFHSDQTALIQENQMLDLMPLSDHERRMALVQANQHAIIETLSEKNQDGTPRYPKILREVQAHTGDPHAQTTILAHWLSDLSGSDPESIRRLNEQPNVENITPFENDGDIHADALQSHLKESFVHDFLVHRANAAIQIADISTSASRLAAFHAMEAMQQDVKNHPHDKEYLNELREVVSAANEYGHPWDLKASHALQGLQALGDLGGQLQRAQYETGVPKPDFMKALPEKFIDLFNGYRNQYMATHVGSAALLEANSMSDNQLEARQNETFDFSHVTEQERIINYANVSSHALSVISQFPGVNLHDVKDAADKEALNHVLEQGQRLHATWANTPEKINHLRELLSDHSELANNPHLYQDIRTEGTNHTTFLSSDTRLVSPEHAEHHGEGYVTRDDFPPGFVASYLAARSAYLAGIERRHVAAAVHASSETITDMKGKLTDHEYKAANTAIAELGGGPFPGHDTHMGANEALARNREALSKGLSMLANHLPEHASSSDLTKFFNEAPAWKNIPTSSRMIFYNAAKKYEQEQKTAEEQLQIGSSSPHGGLSWHEVLKPSEHGKNNLEKSLHENPAPEMFGIPSESNLEHTADQDAAHDLARQEPGTHFNEHEYQTATYNAQTHALSTLGLSPQEQTRTLYVINRDAILGAIGSGSIPASAIHDHPEEFRDFTSLNNHHSSFNEKPGEQNAIYNDQYSSALLHERERALQSVEAEVKTANEIGLHKALLDFEAHALSSTSESDKLKGLDEVARLRATLEKVGHGNTSNEKELDALKRYMSGEIHADDLPSVPESFLNDFKRTRIEALRKLPTTAPLEMAPDTLENTGEGFQRMREMAETVHQGLLQSRELENLPIASDRMAYTSVAINHLALQQTLEAMPQLPEQFKEHLSHLLKEKHLDKADQTLENNLQLISTGDFDPALLHTWTSSTLSVPLHLLTREQGIQFGEILSSQRGELLKSIRENLEDENIRAAERALNAGLSRNEPWAIKSERIIQSHVRPSETDSQAIDNPKDSAAALQFADKALSQEQSESVKSVLLRMGHGQTDEEKREDALKQIYDHINNSTSDAEMDQLDHIIPGGLRNFIHDYELEYAEQQHLRAFLSELGNGSVNWHTLGIPVGFVKEYNAQLSVDGNIHKALHATGADIYAAPIPGVPNHEQHVDAHERIDSFRNLHHDADFAQHLLQQDMSSTGLQEHFAPWQYLDAIGAENKVVADLPLMNHREREFAFQNAVHAAYLDLASSGKYDHGINTLISKSDWSPLEMLQKLEQVFQENHSGTLDQKALNKEYSAFENLRYDTGSLQKYEHISSELESHSTDQTLSNTEKIKNALQQIESGELTWQQVGVSGHWGAQFIESYEDNKKALGVDPTIASTPIESLKALGLGSRFAHAFLASVDKHLVTIGEDAHSADVTALEKFISYEHTHGRSAQLEELSRLGTGSTERLKLIDAIHKIGEGKLSESGWSPNTPAILYFKNVREQALRAQPSTAGISLASSTIMTPQEWERLTGGAETRQDNDQLKHAAQMMHEISEQQHEIALAHMPDAQRSELIRNATHFSLIRAREEYAKTPGADLSLINRYLSSLRTDGGSSETAGSLLLSGMINLHSHEIPKDFMNDFLRERGEYIQKYINIAVNKDDEESRADTTRVLNRVDGGLGTYGSSLTNQIATTQTLAMLTTHNHSLVSETLEQLKVEFKGKKEPPAQLIADYAAGKISASDLDLSPEFIQKFNAERRIVATQIATEFKEASSYSLDATLAHSEHKAEIEHLLLHVAGSRYGDSQHATLLESMERLMLHKKNATVDPSVEASYREINQLDPSFFTTFESNRIEHLQELPLTATIGFEMQTHNIHVANLEISALTRMLSENEFRQHYTQVERDLEAHASNQSLPFHEKVKDSLQRIERGDLTWEQVGVHGSWAQTFIQAYNHNLDQLRHINEERRPYSAGHDEAGLNIEELTKLGVWDTRLGVDDARMTRLGIPPQARAWVSNTAMHEAVKENQGEILRELRNTSGGHTHAMLQSLDEHTDPRNAVGWFNYLTSGFPSYDIPAQLIHKTLEYRLHAIQHMAEDLSNARLNAFHEAENEFHEGQSSSWRHHLEHNIDGADHPHGSDTEANIRDALTKIETGEKSWSDFHISPQFQALYERLKLNENAYKKMPSILARRP